MLGLHGPNGLHGQKLKFITESSLYIVKEGITFKNKVIILKRVGTNTKTDKYWCDAKNKFYFDACWLELIYFGSDL